jgi:phosphoribosylformimino-5-aminoimidazole carboxamide ribotide isomerase
VPLAYPARWDEAAWSGGSSLPLAGRAADLGVQHVILLDLTAVGTAAWPVTLDACRAIARDLPHLRLWTGGGVRSIADVNALADGGAHGVLMASALHDASL